MSQPSFRASSVANTDLMAAEFVEDLANRLQAGEPVDLESCAREHPECAERIRRLLPAVEMLADLGRLSVKPARNSEPSAGILGDFRLLREVGRGGMGVVYEAEQISLQRRVALKVLPFAAMLDPRQLQRFHNEARAAACLHHPNIVPVHAVGCDRGVHYYAMQFIEGQTLAALIQGLRRQAGLETKGQPTRRPRSATIMLPPALDLTEDHLPQHEPSSSHSMSTELTPVVDSAATTAKTHPASPTRAAAFFRRVAQLGVQAAEALEHAHQEGVVHRDIKPANILLDIRGNLWITDFGLAQFQAEAGMTASGDLVGTLRYISPENACGGPRFADHRVDIYSLGVTLYELLTLEPAFRGDDRQELLRQIMFEEPRSARRLDPSVPLELETIVAKAMAKDPVDRYGTAQEVADDLGRFLDDQPIRARRPSLWQQGRRWARRNRQYVWSLGLFVALVVLASVVGALVFGFKESELAAEQRGLVKHEKVVRKNLELDHFAVLMSLADSRRAERAPGYRDRVLADLKLARELHMPENGLEQIRDRWVACLGDPLGLSPVDSPTVARATRSKVPRSVRKWLTEQHVKPDSLIAASADGKRLAYVAETSVLQVLIDSEIEGVGKFRGYWACPLGAIYDLEFAPDGYTVVAGCEHGIVTWELQNRTAVPLLLRSQMRVGNVTSVAVHPEGHLLATGGKRVELWSLEANQRVASFPNPAVDTKVAFSADGKLLLAVVGGTVVRGWPVTETPEKILLQARQGGVPSVVFNPNGTRLASGSGNGVARIWDVQSGKLLHTWRASHLLLPAGADFPQSVESVDFSPDGRWLATGDYRGRVSLWNVETGLQASDPGWQPNKPPGRVWRLHFSPSGDYLAAAGDNGVAVWKVRVENGSLKLEPEPKEVVPPEQYSLVYDLAIHPGEREFVFLSARGKLYAAPLEGKGEPRLLHAMVANQLRGLHFDDAGHSLTFVTKSQTLALLDWQAGTTHDTGLPAFFVGLRGGRWVALSQAAHNVTIFDLEAGKIALTLPEEQSEIWDLNWSRDGRHLAVGMSDGGIAIWDLEKVRESLRDFGIENPSTAIPAWQ